jgi:16S rRNA (cytosine1402-N4)-methyltransferase
MLNEAVAYLNCRTGKVYVDGTLGGAGHAQAICRQIQPDGIFIGIDQDRDAIQNARDRLTPFAPNVHLFHGNFANMPECLTALGFSGVDGILLDLGLSLHQLQASGRGFSFKRQEPLDMRMDQRDPATAGDLVNTLDEKALAGIFKRYGEVSQARRIARSICAAREKETIRNSKQLADVVQRALPSGQRHKGKIHPATKIFMALRIAVNSELERLQTFLDQATEYLNPGGRICIISFHSLEDRPVKQWMQKMAKQCICPPGLPQCGCHHRQTLKIITRKPVLPSAAEVQRNPMSRSAKLRVGERI